MSELYPNLPWLGEEDGAARSESPRPPRVSRYMQQKKEPGEPSERLAPLMAITVAVE